MEISFVAQIGASIIFLSLISILVLLITFLVVKNRRERAKVGLIAGALLIILDFLFIFVFFYNNSNPLDAFMNLFISTAGTEYLGGFGLFFVVGPILFAWSYFVLKGKESIADSFDKVKLN